MLTQDFLNSRMRPTVSGSVSGNAHTTDANYDNTDDKLLRRYVNRKNIEDSLFDEAREGLFKKGTRKHILSPNLTLISKGNPTKERAKNLTAFDIFNTSPRKTDKNHLLQAIPGAQIFKRAETNEIGNTAPSGEKVSRKQVKSYPLAIFVDFFLI